MSYKFSWPRRWPIRYISLLSFNTTVETMAVHQTCYITFEFWLVKSFSLHINRLLFNNKHSLPWLVDFFAISSTIWRNLTRFYDWIVNRQRIKSFGIMGKTSLRYIGRKLGSCSWGIAEIKRDDWFKGIFWYQTNSYNVFYKQTLTLSIVARCLTLTSTSTTNLVHPLVNFCLFQPSERPRWHNWSISPNSVHQHYSNIMSLDSSLSHHRSGNK